jgi:citrate synthase
MDSGLEGVIAANTVLSHIDGREGTILVRGHTIDDLVRKALSRSYGTASRPQA